MDLQLLLAAASFAFITSATPGPNNLMLTASGVTFGFRKSLPHILGISIGVGSLVLVTAAGLGSLFSQSPALQQGLKIVGSIYLLWLAWQLLSFQLDTNTTIDGDQNNSQNHSQSIKKAKPFRLWQALLFQYVNPKAWLMAISAVGSFTLSGDDYWTSAWWLTGVFFVVNLPSVSLWAGFGTLIGQWISEPRQQKLFGMLMAGLTALTVLLIWQ